MLFSMGSVTSLLDAATLARDSTFVAIDLSRMAIPLKFPAYNSACAQQ
jgi:hypothetical protein